MSLETVQWLVIIGGSVGLVMLGIVSCEKPVAYVKSNGPTLERIETDEVICFSRPAAGQSFSCVKKDSNSCANKNN